MSSVYFPSFKNIQYPFLDSASLQWVNATVVDITENVVMLTKALQSIGNYVPYNIVDGDTPQSIAESFYGSRYYDWVIILANNIIDPFYDFPMTITQLMSYCSQKYGVTNVNAIHHYSNASGFIVDQTAPGAYPVTNYDYETEINDAKRNIYIVQPAYIPTLRDNLIALLSS